MSEPDYLMVGGKRLTIDEIDEHAHHLLHDADVSPVARGLAAMILALIDDRRRGHLPSLAEMRKVTEETRRVENLKGLRL